MSKTGPTVSAEEHPINGGPGESGKPDELMQKYGLTADNIVAADKKAIGRK